MTDIHHTTTATSLATTWPYCAGSDLIGRELAANIRTWALTRMSQAELHSHSQRQLLRMYISQHSVLT
jgi:hypothetical protein